MAPPELTVSANDAATEENCWTNIVFLKDVEQAAVADVTVINRYDDAWTPPGRLTEINQANRLCNFANILEMQVHEFWFRIMVNEDQYAIPPK
jgi:hypothetical protein